MFNRFGVFINLDYAHNHQDECSLVWQKIMAKMHENGFSFEKRTFVISTNKNPNELSMDLRRLFDEILTRQHDFYSFISECYVLNCASYTDLTLPDTSKTIAVKDLSLEDLDALGVEYKLLFENS
ncbi:MAG: hypothetical protein QNL62_09050 [Gammaproteobacteria bacterium]|nr:hypothetical protein [Gammaproteobacteria bacterium]